MTNLEDLTQEQRQAIHRGLKLSEVDLERLRKNALAMGLPGAVHEVDEHLRMLRGGPDGTAGLLQLFANQTELFVEGADRDERQLNLEDGGGEGAGTAASNGEGSGAAGIEQTDISTSLDDYEAPDLGEHDDAPPGPLADTVAAVVEKARPKRKPRPSELRKRAEKEAKKGKGGGKR